jgi:SAM-dependent methyltransferase
MQHKVRSLLQGVRRRVIRPFKWLKPSAIHANPFVSSKLYPVAGKSTEHVQLYPGAPATGLGERLPVPPMDLWEGYASTEEEYLEGGRHEMATMVEILSKAGASPQELARVLDFGCAAGRMLRFYPRHEGTSELWGVDINARHINWCQLNLSPPFLFATTTTAPHLPFEDGYFDLIYADSVFTHINDLADTWLLELRRIVRKGGYLYITIHDRRTVEVLLTKYQDHPHFTELVGLVQSFCERTGVRSQNYAYFTILADPISQVFYNEDYLVRKWSQWAEVLSVTPEAHYHQAALLLRK